MIAAEARSLRGKFVIWWDNLFQYRYYLLLIALLAMMVVPSFSQESDQGFLWSLTRTFVLIACINVLRNIGHSKALFLILGLLTIGSDWLVVLDMDSSYTDVANLLLSAFFVCMISYEVFREIIVTKQIDMHIIVGAFCGFMLVGMIASLVFTFLHIGNPESFSNVDQGLKAVDDLFYFSYITILTIGYGDIAPITSEARGVSLFFGLIGQFYLVVIMAVLVGKFIGKS